jgi:serine/threonine protein kinase/ABC-type branched-subunit amino acid transport system substrate-binding protein
MQIISTLKHCPVCGKEYTEGDVCTDDGATLIGNAVAPDPLLGQVLKGTYKIIERIAQGGMGVVYRAAQMPLGRTVAIKAIFANPLISSDLVQRFFREARLLSQVNHPNVVSLIDFGNTESGVIYMVMEYLTGRTLDKVIPRDRGLPLDMVLDLMEQICAGVAAAHRNSMVHRDLKPSNIFLANMSGDAIMVKVLDFGIAKTVDDKQGPLTQNGVMIGSSGYMSPEQISGATEIDGRSDVYALGGLLYYMLAGQPAYRGGNTRTILTKQLAERPEEIDFDKLGKPEAKPLMSVILTAMEQEPHRRYQSAVELINAIRAAVGVTEGSTASRLRQQILIQDLQNKGGSTMVPNASGVNTAQATPVPAPPGQAQPGTNVPATVQTFGLDARTRKFLYIGGTLALFLLAYIAYLLIVQLNRDSVKAAPGGPEAKSAEKKRTHPAVAQQGVTDEEITLGMSAAFSGPARELGRGMKLGVETYLRHLNENGGVDGRKVRLIALDDGYDPARVEEKMKELNDSHKVFAYIGNVGTPTAAKAIPYALDHKLIFYGAFTGAKILRKDPPDRYVFNFRASYGEETAATVKYLIEIKKIKPEQIAVFAQQEPDGKMDPYGQAGFDGVAKALRKYGRDPEQILRVGYTRNTSEVSDAVNEVVKHRDDVRAIIMVPTYKPAAQFIKRLKDAKVDAIFASVSFVGSEALAEELKQIGPQYAEGVMVTQVVPHYDSKSTAVLRYREALKKYFPDEQPSFISLEGYLAASLLCEAMQKSSENLTTDSLIETLEGIHNLDIGVGAAINFGPSEHQGSHKVWGTILDKSVHYQILDLD